MQRIRAWMRKTEEAPLSTSLFAIAIATAVSLAVAEAAGIHRVQRVLEGVQPIWLAPMLGARVLSYVGYTAAHRATLTPGLKGWQALRRALRAVAFGAAATSLEGGFSIDQRLMRGEGASSREATVSVLNLGALELATLAPAAWVCSLLLLSDERVRDGVTLPWAIGVPAGLVLALVVAPHLSSRALARHGPLGRALSRLLDALSLLVRQLRHPLRFRLAWLGMCTYWACEILSLWAALRLFGIKTSADVVVLAYATGHVLTPRSLPLSGVGVTELLLSLALNSCGVPLAAAVPAVYAYRLALLALAIPPAVAARGSVREL
ncbi:MAG TPA: lysylphosphatidylglycerol synthase domain-containing protein, partial [Solirubrobacteraceae bacterium]|nr:lysylphosphatidylglycerol synthase domain-containing protein [Solirubrobacteraceae bacterium]